MNRRDFLQTAVASVGIAPFAATCNLQAGTSGVKSSPRRVYAVDPDGRRMLLQTPEFLPRGGNRTGMTNLNAVNLAVILRGDNWWQPPKEKNSLTKA